MTSINKELPLWSYMSRTQRDLIQEGDYIVNIIGTQHRYTFKDYSFLIFPFAKAYEGFLKQLFLDIGFISQIDYVSDHFRLGKYLSPHLMQRLEDRSLYRKIIELGGEDLAEDMWRTWKLGRNEIFHYYPHNTKGVTFHNAEVIIANIVETMNRGFKLLQQSEQQRTRRELYVNHS